MSNRDIATNNYSSESNTSSILSICFISLFLLILVAGAVVAYFLLNQEKSHRVQTGQELETDTVYLIHETNYPEGASKCEAGKTYFVDNDELVVRDGCSGVFLYRDKFDVNRIGVCTSPDLNEKRCMVNFMKPSPSISETKRVADDVNPIHTVNVREVPLNLSLSGMNKMNNELIFPMKHNGKCTDGNYGFLGNNKIFVDNGCDGVFRVGPLIGACSSVSSTPGEDPTRTLCPIGYREEIDGRQMGLVLSKLNAQDSSEKCQTATKPYGYHDVVTGFVNPNLCEGGLKFEAALPSDTLYVNHDFDCNPVPNSPFQWACNLRSFDKQISDE